MSKLIYSPTSAILEGTYDGIKNRDQSLNPVYHSVAFTGDGFIYTHGKKFRLFTVENNQFEGLTFQVTNGTAGLYIDNTLIGQGTVVQSVTGDTIVTASTTNGAVTLGHAELLGSLSAGQYGSTTAIPIITVNSTGHITAIQNSGTIDVSKIRANSTTTTGNYYPVGVTNTTLQNPVYNTSLYFDENGNIYTNNVYIGNSALSSLFAPLNHTTVYATDSVYGHVLLSDSADNTNDTTMHIAVTPKALYTGINEAKQHAINLFAAQDAMVFVGTLEVDGTITSHNSDVAPTVIDNTTNITYLNYKTGWTFRFIEAGTFNGIEVEVGDMIIAVHSKENEFDIDDWTVIQTNISGALTATSNLNGILYANNSRTINSLAFSDGILKYSSSGLAFVNPNSLWRDIKINSTSIGTNGLNLISGNAVSITNVDGDVTIAVNASNIIGTSAALSLVQGNLTFSYTPATAATINIGNALTFEKDEYDNYTLRHASYTPVSNKLGSITTDSYGHITALQEVSTLPNPEDMIFKVNNTQVLSYDGSQDKVLVFSDGTDISFNSSTNANDDIIITPSITHKYRSVQFYSTKQAASPTSVLANNVSTILTLIGGDNVSLSNVNSNNEALPEGTIVINAEDTWRDIQAYGVQSGSLARASLNSTLNFNNDFLLSTNQSGVVELGIMWTEVDEEGRVTYVK